jgi:hypothetical protein
MEIQTIQKSDFEIKRIAKAGNRKVIYIPAKNTDMKTGDYIFLKKIKIG